MEPFAFGCQYLRGMTPGRDCWARDMATMRHLGFNTIRAWLVWGVLEPACGEVDLEYLQTFLDLARRNELRVIGLFHLHGAPEWAIRTHRACWYVDETGRAFEPSARPNTPSGGWPGLCPDHLPAQELEERFIETVCRTFAGHPALWAMEPVNEPHMWVDFTRSPSGVFCYCEQTRQRFVDWLQHKYQSLSRLEAAWGRRLGGWEDVRPPTWRFGLSDWVDWRLFTAHAIAGHMTRRVGIIRRHFRGPVLAHSWGGGSCACPDLGGMAFDDWRNAATVDKWGCSSFPSTLRDTPLVGLAMDASRSAAAGGEYWQSELGAGDYGCVLQRQGRVPPQHLEQWSWESLRHGAAGLLYWQFRKEAQGNEAGAYGLCDYAGRPSPNARAVAGIGKILSENSALFLAARPVQAQVGILFSLRSYLLNWAQARNCELTLDALCGYYRIFWDADLPVDILHEDALADDLGRYRLLVLPFAPALAPEAAKRLRDYVAAGGTLLADPYGCAFDGDLHLSAEVPGEGLAELFGCSEDDIARAQPEVLLRNAGGREWRVAGSYLQARWRLGEQAEPLAFYEDGTAAVVSRRAGEGRAVLSGVMLGSGCSPKSVIGDLAERGDTQRFENGNDAAGLVLELADAAGVGRPLRAERGLRASLLTAGEKNGVLIVLNQRAETVCGGVTLQAGSYRTWTDLISKASGELISGYVPLSIEAYGSAVLRLEA